MSFCRWRAELRSSPLVRALGQGPHFVGHHGEAAPLLPGPGRFNRGVEGKQVGLLRDTGNDGQHLVDFLAVAIKLLHDAHGIRHGGVELVEGAPGIAHHGVRSADFPVGVIGLGGGVGGVAGDFPHAGRHFVHGGGGLFQLAALVLAALLGIGGSLLQRLHLGNDGARQLLNAPRQITHLLYHRVVGREHLAHFVIAALDRDGGGEVAVGHQIQAFPQQAYLLHKPVQPEKLTDQSNGSDHQIESQDNGLLLSDTGIGHIDRFRWGGQ